MGPGVSEHITVATQDGVATITLNRPEKLNAFTPVMQREIVEALAATDADDDVRVVVVTGAGRAFCAGADLSGGLAAPNPAASDADLAGSLPRDGGGVVSLRIAASLKPVIAAINGAAVGVGVTMTLPMDIRLVADGAKLGFVFARRGIVPEACSSWFLPRIVGVQQALEWVYSAEILTAEAAFQGRLVRSVHAPEELLPAVYELARSFVVNRSPVALGLAKQLIYRNSAAENPLAAHLADSLGMFYTSIGDGKEGVAAFLEKRTPSFSGRASALPRIFEE